MEMIREPINYFPACIAGGIVLFTFIFLHSKREFVRVIFYHLVVFSLLLGLLEAYAYFAVTFIQDQPYSAPVTTKEWMMKNDVLGYAPIPSVRIRDKQQTRTEVIFDVMCTINEDGQRSVPRYEYDPVKDPAVIMFGCSFTFGQGVQDPETIAYKVGETAKLNVYNFGFGGYGPQQMLAALDQGLVKKIVRHEKAIVIYQAVPFQIPRSAGFSSWDQHSAKYVLGRDGVLRYAGHFDDHSFFAKDIVRHSYLYKLFLARKYIPRQKDIDLYLEIIGASARRVAEQFKDQEFHVILWPDTTPDSYAYQHLREVFETSGIRMHLIADIIKDYEMCPAKYQLHPKDIHPNPLAYALIADYICKEILK
jgi:hypothetical protein